MATNTQRIDELSRLVHQLTNQHAPLELEVEWSQAEVVAIGKTCDELRKADEDSRLRIALRERELDILKKSHDLWGNRGWQLVAGILLAVVGGVVGYFLKR
jgi:hypothetical protein